MSFSAVTIVKPTGTITCSTMPEPLRYLRKDFVGRMLRRLPEGFWYKSAGHKLKWLNHSSFADGGRRYARSLGYFYFREEFREPLFGERLKAGLNGFDPEEAICSYFDCADAEEVLGQNAFHRQHDPSSSSLCHDS